MAATPRTARPGAVNNFETFDPVPERLCPHDTVGTDHVGLFQGEPVILEHTVTIVVPVATWPVFTNEHFGQSGCVLSTNAERRAHFVADAIALRASSGTYVAASTSRTAASVASISAAPCALLTNAASNWLGAR